MCVGGNIGGATMVGPPWWGYPPVSPMHALLGHPQGRCAPATSRACAATHLWSRRWAPAALAQAGAARPAARRWPTTLPEGRGGSQTQPKTRCSTTPSSWQSRRSSAATRSRCTARGVRRLPLRQSWRCPCLWALPRLTRLFLWPAVWNGHAAECKTPALPVALATAQSIQPGLQRWVA